MKKIFKILKTTKYAEGKITILLILYLLQALLQVAQPEVLNRATSAIEAKSQSMLVNTIYFAVFVTLSSLAVDAVIKLGLIKYKNTVLTNVQADLLGRVIGFKRSRFQKAETTDYLTGVVDYAEGAVQNSIEWFFSTCSGICVLVVCTVYMGYLNIWLTVIVIVFNVLLRLVLIAVEKQTRKNVAACNRIVRENNNFLVEILANMMTIRVYHKQEHFSGKLLEKEKRTYWSRIRNNMWNNGQSEFIWCSLKFAEYVLVYGIGGLLYYQGYIDFGLFLAYPIALDYFVKAINTLFSTLVYKNAALSTVRALDWLYEEGGCEEGRETVSPKEKELMSSGEIRFEHVSFAYTGKDGSRHEILKNVSFHIEPGDKVLLQGQNGEGKSTLLSLISGQYRPDAGEIFYGSVPSSALALKVLAQNYGLITQESELYNCNIQSNISLGHHTDREVFEGIMRKLRMGEKVDSEVSHLSQGEKQRVNIARAFRKSREGEIFLLGDEILSNIDQENAQNVLQLIDQEFPQKTVILVTHGECSFPWNKKIVVEAGGVTVEKRTMI